MTDESTTTEDSTAEALSPQQRWNQAVTEQLAAHRHFGHGLRALVIGIGGAMLTREARMYAGAADQPGFHIDLDSDDGRDLQHAIEHMAEELFDRLRESNSAMIEKVRDLHQFDSGGLSDAHVSAAVEALRTNYEQFDGLERQAQAAIKHYFEFDVAPETDEAESAQIRAHKAVFHSVDIAQKVYDGHITYFQAIGRSRDEDRAARRRERDYPRGSLGALLGEIFEGRPSGVQVVEIDLSNPGSILRGVTDIIAGL